MLNKFKIVSVCNITKNKQMVISEDLNTGNIVIGKRFLVEDINGTKDIYEKGSIVVSKEEFKKVIVNESMEEFLSNIASN